MPSKGIDVYSYTSLGDVEIEFTVPGRRLIRTVSDNFTRVDLEIESGSIPGAAVFTGEFGWRVLQGGAQVAGGANRINSLSGRLEGGTMTKTEACLSVVRDGFIVTYGFYDAGAGFVGLPSRDQFWVTVTPDHSDWMGDVAYPGSPEAAKPFNRFVVAAPHDDGMNSMQSTDTVLQGINADAIKDLTPHIKELQWFADIVPSEVLIHMLPDIVYGLAMTQKDRVPTMLALGARYFEFRPADLMTLFQGVSPIANKLYFQHACIPGLAFDEFLEQQVQFLVAHPTEIVTLHVRWDNIISECRRPSLQDIEGLLGAACAKAAEDVVAASGDGDGGGSSATTTTASAAPLSWGGSECFDQPIDALRQAGKRLILLIEAQKYDSWTAAAYATLTAGPILAQFEGMSTAGQAGGDVTVLQCQATSQSIKEVLVHSVMASNASTSSLTATKGDLDRQTLPWIRANLLERLGAAKLVVIMNDFIDGATTDTAVQMSKLRLAL